MLVHTDYLYLTQIVEILQGIWPYPISVWICCQIYRIISPDKVHIFLCSYSIKFKFGTGIEKKADFRQTIADVI